MQVDPVSLIGRTVRLEPLAESHVADLAAVGLTPFICPAACIGDSLGF
ncbi:MAG: hypothetical protein BWY52_01077 [Chloroflexi bacterium ADurb.Bin325]|nr:MAG: hypothetical protein BWY52_01077 [Chloroflexi bacterium ADurb.Bin325]